MPHLPAGMVRQCRLLLVLIPFTATLALAQFETATVSGQVSDPSGLSVSGAQVNLVDVDRGTSVTVTTNNSGLYRFASVHPGRYRMEVRAAGFRLINATGLTVNVQDHLEQNFRLTVGSVSESVTVDGGAPLVDTETGTVSTVVDRQFAENLPMNGRSFQTLIDLTPGVVVTATNSQDNGQFTINGQRAASNYWMVDGVGANIGANSSLNVGNGLAGAVGSTSVLGGTNSLVSVDAMQEFRIQTSTYAPEFGRTPGGQISIVTRSGTNQFHGTLFDYFRNDALDANNWFNGYTNSPVLPKAKERQNDFGGVFSGPIFKDRTFFFFSYEGLRLRLPQTTLTNVPDLAARQNASLALQPFLNAFPIPNGQDLGSGAAQFNASYSDPATLDAYSLRIDHRLKNDITFFGRYNYSPSQIIQRGNGNALSTVSPQNITTQTGTFGLTWAISPVVADDFRFNYSRTNAEGHFSLDSFGGAIPLASLPFPSPYTNQTGLFQYNIILLTNGIIGVGKNVHQLQRQINVVDNLSLQKASHSLKFGVDFRRLAPLVDPELYSQVAGFLDVPSAETGSLYYYQTLSNQKLTFLFNNLGVFAQDTWRVFPRLTLTYGLRWDLDFAPSTGSGPNIAAVTGYDPKNLAQLALAPAGTPPFKTSYGNVAPRIGIAYQLSQKQDRETILRGGFGAFYDLATSGVGNLLGFGSYPFSGNAFNFGGTFPLDSTAAAPPPITASSGIVAVDPNLKLPYALEWNVAVEQAIGRQQSVSSSYVGSVGRRLLQSAVVFFPNATFQRAELIGNTSTSDYHALQLQFQRRLSHGIQALASYTWSHAIDDASAGSVQDGSNTLVPATTNRGPSSFDIRNTFSVGLTYDVHVPRMNSFAGAILNGWSTENFVVARTAPPVDVALNGVPVEAYSANARPDVIPGIPLYLYGSQYPGGKAINNTPGAVVGGCPDGSPSTGPFCNPPIDPVTFVPARQGNLPRNALRGFGATQWDFAVHRDFPIRESLKLQFRAEMFNVLNHPNFGAPDGNLFHSTFGNSTQMLGQYLSGGNIGGGGLSPLYQLGGPRSIQLALKLMF